MGSWNKCAPRSCPKTMWGTAPIAWVVATGSARDAGGWGSIPDSGVNKGVKNGEVCASQLGAWH